MSFSRDLSDEKATVAKAGQRTGRRAERFAGATGRGPSCALTSPLDITPTVSVPGVTLSARGGWGTIVEDTGAWSPCSYTATLTTRPGLTTGLIDRSPEYGSLTFCICGHSSM